MGAELLEFEARDNGQNAGTGYPGPMSYGMGGGESLFQIIWRGKWLILLSTIVGLAGAFLYLRRTTPTYQSTSRILVDKPSSQPGSDAPVPVGSTLGNLLATQASIITSPQIVSAALRDPNVLALPTFADPNYVKDLVGTLVATPAKNTDIIQVTASSPHPDDAAQIVNAVVRAYIRWHEANRKLSTADLLKDLNSQLEKRSSDLQMKRKEQMLFEQRHPEVVENTPGGMLSKALDVLRTELTTARLKAVERDAYYQGLQRLEKEPDIFREYIVGHRASAAGEQAERLRLQTQLQATQFQLAELQAAGTAQRTSQVTMLQGRQRELVQQIADYDTEFIRKQIALAKTLAEDARTQAQKIGEMYDKEFTKAQNLSEQDSEYAFLKSECEILGKLYDSLLSQIGQLDLSARLEGLKISVLGRATPAGAAASPQLARVLGIGLVLGLMLGAGLALLRDWRDQRVRSANEILAILGAPILGAIPSMSQRARVYRRQLQADSNSREAEACRALRTTLLYGTPQERTRTILVTSPSPLEGKTTLVNGLAIAMAQAGQRTLIVDADLRKPAQQRLSSSNGSDVGLTDVLAGTAALDQAIRATETDGLNVLASGRSPSNPAELLSSRAFAALLEQLEGRYDRILVDSPPLAVVTDAQILATLCGSTLLVLRADKSSRLLTERARDALLAVGVRVAGAVVTDVSPKAGGHRYYSGYGYDLPHQGSNGHKAAPREPSSDTAVGPEQASSSPGAGESRAEAAHLGQRDDGDQRPTDRTVPLEIKEYDGKAKGQPPRSDRDSRRDHGAQTGETKE